MPCMSLIVAMSMECEFVTEFFPASLTSGRNMIDFNHISVFEMQVAPAAFSSLLLQKLPFDAADEVVFAESLAPIQQISIVRASGSLDFDMSLNMGLRVIP